MDDADSIIAAVVCFDAAMRKQWERAPARDPERQAMVVARRRTRAQVPPGTAHSGSGGPPSRGICWRAREEACDH